MNSLKCSTAGRGPFSSREPARLFRLWIARYERWQPRQWNDVPPLATALELIEDDSFSEQEARLFLEGFNSQMLTAPRSLWAVAVPVVVRFEGDAQPGERIHGHAFDRPLASACE